MRRFSLLFLVAMLSAAYSSAQNYQANKTGNDRFSVKVQPFLGSYMDKSANIKNIKPGAPTGMIMGVEFPSSQQRPWQQYLKNPTVGLGITTLDLGHDERMGHAFAMYPYILLNGVRREHFELKVKLASGLGVVSEHWYTQEDTNPDHYHNATTSTTFGSYLNVYLNAGLDINFPITRNMTINSEVGYIHMCNGRICMPNIGANIIYGGVGLTATLNPTEEKAPMQFPDLPYGWSLNITGSAGAHRAWMNHPLYLISSFHTGAVYYVNNWYGVGMGVDVFYNGAIDKETGRSLYRQDREYTTADKIRAGVALNNEFKFGLFTAILDWGVYLYNPSRNYYYDLHPIYGHGKRPLFYKSQGVGSDEAFHYIRLGSKLQLWDNLFVQASAKLHLNICEYVEFGLGYQIPFLKKNKRMSGEGIVYHHHRNWWEDYK